MNMMQQGLDINRLRQEARVRWLKPSEVFFVLKNHDMFQLANEPPTKPPSGSLFLFNKRILRFFRKDGHPWRRKRDGRTIGEAHERLKVGNVDALNCYYAHGEQNPYFQRRVYWMLDPAYEHIVLVHYLEVADGRYTSSISKTSAESSFQENVCSDVQKTVTGCTFRSSDRYEPRESPCSIGSHEEVSSRYATDHGSLLKPEVNQALRKLAMQLSLDNDTTTYFGENLPPYSSESGSPENQGFLGLEPRNPAEESFENLLAQSEYKILENIEDAKNFKGNDGGQLNETSYGYSGAKKEDISWKNVLEMSLCTAEYPNGITSDYLALNHVDNTSTFRAHGAIEDSSGSDTTDYVLVTSPKGLVSGASYAAHYATDKPNGSEISKRDMYIQLSEARRFLLGSDNPIESPTSMSQLPEIVKPSYSSPETNIIEGSTVLTMDAPGMWFDQCQYQNHLVTDSSSNVAHRKHFSIHEISPEWAFAYESTKVLIVGDLFVASEGPWAVMFGDTEVPLEIVRTGVFRCHTPKCIAGKVSLCITSGNREPCSQIREFEFRANNNIADRLDNSLDAGANKNSEEMLLLVRFVHLLLCEYDNRSILKGDSLAEAQTSTNSKATSYHWELFIEAFRGGRQNQLVTTDWVLQELLKDKLQQWLSCKCPRESTGTDCLLSKQEQGIIHIISGLGYEWALAPILGSGVGVNFRDGSGWTALHWAARFGREKMVAALLAAGASAGAVTDPTSQDPDGKTPAALAALNGHKGLAGYLSEAALTSHLSSLVLQESETSKRFAAREADKAVESISQRTIQTHGGTDDQLSLKDSLAAVRNAAQAAARIQAAFRAHSFKKRQQNAAPSCDECGLTLDNINELSAAYKFYRNTNGSREKNLDKAALSIQKKYKGWKGRKEFLNFRQNVVKIQAHVRGHQVRKNYKEFVSLVSVLEKVVLRWRRKGVGLRGYRAEPELIVDNNDQDDDEEEDIVKLFRKTKVNATLDGALSRVLSMVDSPKARQQYRRMLECYREAKAGSTSADEAKSRSSDDLEFIGSYDFEML